MVNIIVHLFFPHESNNHRSKTLHPSVLVFYIVLLLLFQVSFRLIKFSRPDILGFATDINTEKLLNLTNLVRAEAGLNSLKVDPDLSLAAEAKARDMFNKNYWAHNAPDGTTPWFFINNSDYKYIYAGENLARDFNNSEGVVSAWMASESHKENLLRKEYRDIGFAVVNGKLFGEETTLVVQMFGSRQPSYLAETKPVNVTVPAATIATLSGIEATPGVSGVSMVQISRNPLINFFTSSKNMASILTLMLLGVLTLDGGYVWRKKIVRLSGHNSAHLLFLLAILGALWFTSQGVIL